MVRLSPWDEPLSCPGSNCSIPITRSPRRARLKRVALPMAPSPITATSKVLTTDSPDPAATATQSSAAADLGGPGRTWRRAFSIRFAHPSLGTGRSNIAAPAWSAGVACKSPAPGGSAAKCPLSFRKWSTIERRMPNITNSERLMLPRKRQVILLTSAAARRITLSLKYLAEQRRGMTMRRYRHTLGRLDWSSLSRPSARPGSGCGVSMVGSARRLYARPALGEQHVHPILPGQCLRAAGSPRRRPLPRAGPGGTLGADRRHDLAIQAQART